MAIAAPPIVERKTGDCVRRRAGPAPRVGKSCPCVPSDSVRATHRLARYDGRVQVASKEVSRGRERCPLCHAPLGAADLPTIARCDRCGTRAHVACTRELNEERCGTPGCERGIVVRVPVRAPTAPPILLRSRRWLLVPALAVAALMVVLGLRAWPDDRVRVIINGPALGPDGDDDGGTWDPIPGLPADATPIGPSATGTGTIYKSPDGNRYTVDNGVCTPGGRVIGE
jgi:hypothetical protein